MLTLTSRIVILSACFACVLACSKRRSNAYFDETARRDVDTANPDNNPSKDDLLREAIAAASAKLDTVDPAEPATALLECPKTDNWQKFDSFAAPCSYTWTTDEKQLPSPPEWRVCSPNDGLPEGLCKQFKRNARTSDYHLGLNADKEMQIGFVEHCTTDQIVLANVDGPTRFALRRGETTTPPTTCQVKLLATDQGEWLAAAGGSQVFTAYSTSGHTIGGAYLGGKIGAAPNVLHTSSTDPFHVATSQGSILPEGWSADGKRRQWNGKPFAKTPHIGMVRLTKRLLVDEKRGFFREGKPEPESLVTVSKGQTISGIQIHEQRIVWQEEGSKHGRKTCSLFTGDVDAKEGLLLPRRIAEIPCATSTFALGCNTILVEAATHLELISLANGATRISRMKGHPLAVDCKEAFVERLGQLFRIDLQAFGAAKGISTPLPD